MISSDCQVLSGSVNLSPRQQRAIPLVLRSRSIDEGCTAAGISRQTWYAWMKDEAFRTEVYARREAVSSEALDRLKSALTGAVEGLTGLVDAGRENIRLRACGQVIDYFMKVREQEEMERRLVVLERAILKDGK